MVLVCVLMYHSQSGHSRREGRQGNETGAHDILDPRDGFETLRVKVGQDETKHYREAHVNARQTGQYDQGGAVQIRLEAAGGGQGDAAISEWVIIDHLMDVNISIEAVIAIDVTAGSRNC